MKLKDILEATKGLDPEAEIVFNLDVGCCGDNEQLIPYENFLDIGSYHDENDKEIHYLRIDFKPFWWFDSCLTYGAAKKAALKHKKDSYGKDWEEPK